MADHKCAAPRLHKDVSASVGVCITMIERDSRAKWDTYLSSSSGNAKLPTMAPAIIIAETNMKMDKYKHDKPNI